MRKFIITVCLVLLMTCSFMIGLYGCQEGNTVSEYSITYMGIDNNDNPTSYTKGSSVVIKNPTKTGYDFLGWTYDGQSNPILELKISENDSGDKVFTANFKAKTYSVELDGLEGAVLENEFLQTTYGQKVGSMPTPIRQGYEFIEWVTDSGQVIDEDTVWNFDDESIRLTARYVRVYTIKFVLKYNVKGVDVYSELVNGTYEHLNLVKSETEENTWLLLNVKENSILSQLPEFAPITKHADPTNNYLAIGWSFINSNNEIITIKENVAVNETTFSGMGESNEIVLYGSCKTEWLNGWFK